MILDHFTDWQKKTADFKKLVNTTNDAGQPIEEWQTVSGGSGIDVNFWTDASRETNQNDRFVDQATGTALVDPAKISFAPDTTMKMVIDSKDYYIEGVDDVAALGDVYILTWRREI